MDGMSAVGPPRPEPADARRPQGLLAAARELLGMELAYLAELRDDALVLHDVDGDTAAFRAVAVGARVPSEHSWCHAMAAGEAPSLVRDAQQEPHAAAHPFVQATGIRAYAGVALRRPDGTVSGTLCCLSRTPRPDLGERDLRALTALSRMAAAQLGAATDRHASVRADLEATAVQALIAALNARENYTAEHSEAVVALALAVGSELGLEEDELRAVGHVALLHDIGKVGVPDAILQKDGGLTAPEWEVMRQHPAIGARIVGAIASLAHLAPAVRAEHERWDGAGSPDGLVGEDIPLSSRICFICDAWHAMTSDRPYRRALAADAARAELDHHAGTQFCPIAIPALLRVLDRPEGVPLPEPAAAEVRLPQVRPDRPLEAELRALIEVSRAVAGAYRLEHVLAVVAEQARAVLCAAGVSVSRWESSREVFRALVNVRDLAPVETPERAEATWRLTGLGTRLLREARSFAASLDDPELPAGERAELEALGKASMVAAPIVVDGHVWGRLDAFAAPGRPALSADHLRFVEALCGQVAAAVGRAELFSQLERLAYEDALTHLPNRRALDERLEAAVAARVDGDGELALLFCDLDGLKLINDRDGHDAGDAALLAAARALAEAAEAFPGSMTTRLGGDEFCVLMDGYSVDHARALARDASHRLAAATEGPLTFSCGVARLDAEHRRSADLFRAADAAQYAAKRVGAGRVFVAESGIPAPAIPHPDGWSRRRFRDAGPHEREALSAFVLAALDGDLADAGVAERLEFVATAFADAYDAARWAISCAAPDGRERRAVAAAERRDRSDAEAPDIRFARRDAPGSPDGRPLAARALVTGGGYSIAADDEAAGASERMLLRRWGFKGVSAAAVRGADGSGWLLELFCDGRTHVLSAAMTAPRLLMGEAVRGAGTRAGTGGYADAVTSRANTSNTST